MEILSNLKKELVNISSAGTVTTRDTEKLKNILYAINSEVSNFPVFQRIAGLLADLIDSNNKNSDLLKLNILINAILYTQAQTGIEGELNDLEIMTSGKPTVLPYIKLKPVLDSLNKVIIGSQGIKILKAAIKDGIFENMDLRVILPLIKSLEYGFGDIFGKIILKIENLIPLLKKCIDIKGDLKNTTIMTYLYDISHEEGQKIYLEALEFGSPEVKNHAIAAIYKISSIPEVEDILIDYSYNHPIEAIRRQSIISLNYINGEKANKRLLEVYHEDKELALHGFQLNKSPAIISFLSQEGEKYLEKIVKSETPAFEDLIIFIKILSCLRNKKEVSAFKFLQKAIEYTEILHKIDKNKPDMVTLPYYCSYMMTLDKIIAEQIMEFNTEEADGFISSLYGQYNNYLIAFCFEADVKNKTPEYIFERYSAFVKNGRQSYEGREIINMMYFFLTGFGKNRTSLYQKYENSFNVFYNPDSRFKNFPQGKINTWDERWIDIMIELKEDCHVCLLPSSNEKKVIKL